jgi:hypothetical protein
VTILRLTSLGENDMDHPAPVPDATAGAAADLGGQRERWSPPRLSRLDAVDTAAAVGGMGDGFESTMISGP